MDKNNDESNSNLIPRISDNLIVTDTKPVEKKKANYFYFLISIGLLILAFFAPSFAIFVLMLLASIVVVIYSRIRYKYNLLINVLFDLVLIADAFLILVFWIFFTMLKAWSFIA